MIKSTQAAKVNRCFRKNKNLSLSLVALSILMANAAHGEQTDAERIKNLEQRLIELEQQIQVQQRQTNNQPTTQSSAPAEIPKTAQRSSHAFDAPDKSIVLSNSNTTLQLGGQIWLDAIYNNGEMTNRAGFQPSSIAYEDNTTKDNTLLTAGQSKLSFKSFTPTAYGAMTTRFEFDMFDSQGNADFHLTHLWGEIGDFGAGQTFSGFMDINSFPNTLEYWGPNSMVFTRQPQIRYNTAVSKQGRIMFTIEKSSSDFALPNNIPNPSYDNINELPDFTGSYLHNGDFGYIKAAMIVRKLGYETTTQKDTTMGYGINVSGLFTLSDEHSIQFQLVHGQGIGRYINDPCCSYYSEETGGVDAGLDDNGSLKAIPVTGGFAYFNKQWDKQWSSAVGYSYLSVDNLNSQKAKSIKNSTYSTANLMWSEGHVKAGVELQYGDLQSKSGLEGDNFRIQTSIGFKY
ncbi:DcaP family trimeric outer membrane transporter [Colwelliaceae bacterium MEBiC 14330]